MYTHRFSTVFLLVSLLLAPASGWAQSGESNESSWYDPDAPYVRISVVEDGVYHVLGSNIADALPSSTTLADIDPTTLRLIENGSEIPIEVRGTSDGSFDSSDAIRFVGHRNRGTDETWAYRDPSDQSSSYHSLYTDTTDYWLTWGGKEGKRYDTPSFSSSTVTTSLRDTVHLEQENTYYYGRPYESSTAFYTESEGYYWDEFSHTNTGVKSNTYTLPVSRRTPSSEQLHLSVRLDSESNSCHRVRLEAELTQNDGSLAFESVASVEWSGYQRQTLTASVSQNRIPDDLRIRTTSINENFSDSSCPDPSSTPNYILLDYIEANYVRRLAAQDDTQRFVAPAASDYTFALPGYSSETIQVYNPTDARRYSVPASSGTETVSVSPNSSNTAFWAVGEQSLKSPAAIVPDESSNWSVASAHGADYVILTTEALLPSARTLADYRRNQTGYSVSVATVQNVFDEFDYGRPTPIAIRRFVRATQQWSPAPEFLAIFGDAAFPIDPNSPSPQPPWNVPSYGYPPSDGWYAMQTEGPEDWSEVLAIGRIPVRSNEQGNLFVDKLRNYETAPSASWKKRMLLLAGGTSESEQQSLQFYSNRWGKIASDTVASIEGEDVSVHTGMDTLQYYKSVNDALDASFQDSLSVDIRRGAAWLNYFGHSAAQTWEIVTDPPSEFDNAGRLPIVVSLGCRTGSFAGGRFEEKSAPSLGEQLVVGDVRPDGTPRDGSLNGGIAHFGESALGNRLPSARINDALIQRVFVDTMRVLGETIRSAKAQIAANFGQSSLYVKHLLQYGLLGDPATQMALPDRPNFHVASNLISIEPAAPTPSENLTVTVDLQNWGMIPSDSVSVALTWEKPTGEVVRQTRQIQRFPLTTSLQYNFTLDQRTIGSNVFRVSVDPENEYTEIDEADNTASKTQVVFSTGIQLISPTDQGVIPTRTPSLQFSSPRQTDTSATVTLQLDSLPSFDSPALQETTTEISTLSEAWTPSRALQDSTTYYWRGRPEQGNQTARWQESQFTVRTDLPDGDWLQQGRLFQTNQNRRLNWSTQSEWTFTEFTRDILISSESGGGGFKGVISVDGTERYENRTLGFGIVVMDGETGRVKRNESFCTYEVSDSILNERRCGGGVDGEQAADLMASFLQSVKVGDYVFIRTRHLARSGTADISDRVETTLRTLGGNSETHSNAMANDSLSYNDLWLMLAKKGTPERTIEQVGNGTNEIIRRTTLSFNHPSGTTTSSPVGPVSNWDSLRWQATGASSAAVQIEVLAADTARVLSQAQNLRGALSLDAIDASVHPYLRFRATVTDSTTRTAPQLKQWNASYEGVPEIALDPAGLQSIPDTVQQGGEMSISIPVANLGPIASPPVRVRYNLTDASNSTTTLQTDTLEALPPGTRDTSSVRFSTADIPGSNVITVTAFTDGPPERITTNNTILRNFKVQPDQTPPSIQILSNGRELPPTSDPINNLQDPSLPFVSTTPSIDIVLRDNNPHLAPNDTSHIEVYLKGGLPSREPSLISEFKRIPFPSNPFSSNNDLYLVRSDSGTSAPLRARFEPTLSSRDSTYTLKVVARDQKGNEVEPYQTSFRVQEEQTIRDLYPYPNPMSTKTTFAFRVEGGSSSTLHDFRLRIYTLSGRLVREFDQTDLDAPLGTDWNTLTWNGRDADGDRVATGIYLYRVRVKGENGTFRGDVEKIAVIR